VKIPNHAADSGQRRRDEIEFLPMTALDALQWPAMAVSLTAAWLVAASRSAAAPKLLVVLASNVLWIIWESMPTPGR